MLKHSFFFPYSKIWCVICHRYVIYTYHRANIQIFERIIIIYANEICVYIVCRCEELLLLSDGTSDTRHEIIHGDTCATFFVKFHECLVISIQIFIRKPIVCAVAHVWSSWLTSPLAAQSSTRVRTLRAYDYTINIAVCAGSFITD